MIVEFIGAYSHDNDDGTRTYTERDKITVNMGHISAVYDHTIVVYGLCIKVMEDYDTILKKLGWG